MTVRISVESVEVATLKPDGRPWDGPGRKRLPTGELPAFFALDLNEQLGRLVQTGDAPPPPDVYVRLVSGEQVLLETGAYKSFDPAFEGEDARAVDVPAGAPLTIQVWDRDLVFDDPIGATTVAAPSAPGRIAVPPFGQVRRLVLRVA